MIKSIQLTNFFSFQEETINLHKQTNLLVGINGSGKSNLFRAVELLKIGIEGNSDGTALQDLILSKYGGFNNILCKANNKTSYNDSIGLEFILDKDILSSYGNMNFREDISYKIVLLRKSSTDNYFVSEKIFTPKYTYLDFFNGKGKVTERHQGGGIQYIPYDDWNAQELSLAKISDFDRDRYLPLVVIKNALREIIVYNYFDTTMSSNLRKAMPATSSSKRLLSDGRNLPQILNYLKIRNKNFYKKIEESLEKINPSFEGFSFNFLGSGTFELMLDEANLDSSIHVSNISDGTLRYLCLLTILYNPDRGKFICINEPEVGLHPDMIHGLSRAITEIAEETDTAFLIATHSPHLLDKFHLENVRVFEKDENNVTTVDEYTEEEFDGWYDHFNVGEMWRAGDIGGKRW